MSVTAIDKFVSAMNQTSDFWSKQIKVTTQRGSIVVVECDGFTWTSDERKEN